jgi:hypothetical protein
MIENGRLDQLKFVPDILENLEPFPLGCKASRVFCGLLNRWPIDRYAVTSYDPHCTYKDDPQQQIHWQEGMPTERKLRKLSQQLRVGDVFTFEGVTIDLRKVMGACSVVEVSKERYHLPMLDFCTEINPDSLHAIKESVSLPRGTFLKSGNSYHYYGYNLMTEEQWRTWMSGLNEGDKLQSVIDGQYLDNSLKRGYAALRLFGYPGTDKTVVPTVVGYVG